MTKHEQLLRYANLKRSRGGILTPDRYFREVQMCFDGGLCPIKSFGLKSQKEWEAALEKAEDQLAYTNDEMVIKAHEKAKGGPVMQFDCIITSTKRDRDRDILETKGASIDAKCPLLWQHISMQPIGAMASVLAHTDEKLAGRFTIADTELGRDAATLIECGALRISHGFEPTKFKPLKDESEGWHIEEFEIFEVSVVSVPSNTDAVITQFSREKLHDPLVKEWAGKLFEQRPTQVSVSVDVSEMEIKAAPCSCQKDAELTTSIVEGGESQAWERKDGTLVPVAKGDEHPWTKSGIPAGCWALPQSFEWVRESLSMQLKDICCDHRGWPFIFATYKDYAVICMEGENGNDEMYKASWGMTKGQPTWTSELKEVDIQVEASVIEKSRKAGKAFLRKGGDEEKAAATTFADWKAIAIRFVTESEDVGSIKQIKSIVDATVAAHESKQRAEQIERENSAVMELLS